MLNLKHILSKKILADCLSGFTEDFSSEIVRAITDPPKSDMGDLAYPCFGLSKIYRKSPALIASELAEKFVVDDLFIKVSATGPYLNIFIDGSVIASKIIHKVLEDWSLYGSSKVGEGKTVVADYSSPNIAKPLGVHHLRSTMIGNAICNLHEKCGYTVERVNYLGDWGTQFGKLMSAYWRWYVYIPKVPLTVDLLAQLYVTFNKEAKKDAGLEKEGRDWFKRLELGDETATRLWKQFKEISLEEFEKIYERLGVGFTQFDGESNYSQAALDVVKECLNSGLAIESQGAIVIEMGGNGGGGRVDPPCILQKSDGATTYLARDVGAVIARHKKHGFEKMLYVVGQAQAFHFKQVFFVLKKMGYDFSKKCHHIPFGLLKFQGAKLSSRDGNMLLLNEVLDTAAQEVANIVKEKGNELDAESIDKIGIGAVVLADLSSKRIKDANFNWKEILNFDGNTGTYLQYTLARCGSIIDKSAQDSCQDMRLYEDKAFDSGLKLLVEKEEKHILLKLDQFGGVINEAAKLCEPAVLAQYTLQLAKLTNKFIHGCRVVQENKTLQVAREALLSCIHVVLREALDILGIPTLEKM